jgi:hypothetical protein
VELARHLLKFGSFRTADSIGSRPWCEEGSVSRQWLHYSRWASWWGGDSAGFKLRAEVMWCPSTAMTVTQRGLQHTHLFSHSPRGQTSRVKGQQGCSPPKHSRGGGLPCLLASGGCGCSRARVTPISPLMSLHPALRRALSLHLIQELFWNLFSKEGHTHRSWGFRRGHFLCWGDRWACSGVRLTSVQVLLCRHETATTNWECSYLSWAQFFFFFLFSFFFLELRVYTLSPFSWRVFSR